MTQLLTRALRRRALAASAALASALLLVTCTGEPVAPGAPRVGQLAIAPIWPAASRLGGLVLDNVRLTVVRLPADTVARVSRTFSPTTTQLTLSVPILLQGTSENLEATLELFSGTTLLFSGTQLVTVGVGGSTSPVSLPVTFAGPGGQVASLALQPRDTTIAAGSTLPFTVTAQDSQQVPVALFYTTWSSSDPNVTIDGAGVATAGSARGTVTITASTPSGARDSTTLTVAPAATQLLKVSGDNQTASSFSPLPLPLVVEVRAADNLPVQGVTVTFAVLSGGGSVDSATATTDAQGRASTGATLGATVGTQSFTASASGTNTVTFAATASSGGVRVWNGSVDGNWTTATNWTPAAVPTAGDSVVVVGGLQNDPTLTGNGSIAALTLSGSNSALILAGNLAVARGIALPDSNSSLELNSGQISAATLTIAGFQAFLDASAGSATIAGAVNITGDRAFIDVGPASTLGATTLSGNQSFVSHAGGTQGPIIASGNSSFWEAGGAVTVTGAPAIQLTGSAFVSSFGLPVTVTINGDVSVGGTAAFFSVSGGDHWTINGNLQTTGGGYLQMNQVTDTVEVNGNITFGGGDESGLLTAGMLFVSGNFSQTGGATSFVGVGTHTVFLDGSGSQTLSFASPGFAASRFQNVIIANSAGGVTTTSDLYASGTAGVTPTAVRTLSGNGSTLFTTILNVSNFTFNNLLLNFTGSTVVTFDTVTFQGYAPTATPLTIVHPGAASPLPFQDIVFTVTPTSGFYLDATDSNPSDGVPLVIDMLNPTPASPGGRVQTAGATVNWTGTGPIIWTGTTSTNWNTASNWSTGAVPTNADDVVIPSGGNQPSVTTSCSAKSLTVNVGATLNLGSINCQVLGNVFADGSIIGSGALQLSATSQLRGSVPSLIVSGTTTLVGPTTLNGNLTITNGSLVVGGQGLGIVGSLITQGTGILVMTNPVDSVVTSGAGTFGGGDETGSLTAGHLILGGSFGQTSGTSGASFAASGTHRTDIGAGGVRIINFASPGAGAGTSHFNDLVVSRAAGGINLANNTFINGQLISHPTGATPLIGVVSGPKVLTVGGVDVSALGVDQHVMTIGAGTITQFDNVAFTGQANGVTQLTIDNPGAATPFNFTALSFAVTPTTGLYLAANDVDGATSGLLTINMVAASPAAPSPSLFSATGGAVVNWPAVGPIIWTGAVNTDWFTGANWSTGVVPVATTDVLIPSGLTFYPSLSSNATAKNLTLQPGASLTVGNFVLTASGSVALDGTVIGNGGVFLNGTGVTLQGSLPGLTSITGTVTLSGPFTATSQLSVAGTGGSLTLNGHTATTGNFGTSGGGVLVMTNPLDTLHVLTSGIAMRGGNTNGKLTAGVVQISGGGLDTQIGPNAFVSTGTKVLFDGNGAQNVANNVGGNTLVDVDINKVAGNLVFSGMPVTGAVRLLSPTSISGSLDVRALSAVAGSTVNLTSLTVNADSLAVAGTYTVGITSLNAGSVLPVLPYTGLFLNGNAPITAAGNITVGTFLTVDQFTDLVLGGHTITVGSDFALGGGASLLTMTNALDTLTVAGNANFSGGNLNGRLTSGAIRIGGNNLIFGSLGIYTSTGTRLVLTGSGAQVFNIQSPATALGQVEIAKTGGSLNLGGSAVTLTGQFSATGGVVVSNGSLSVAGVNVDGLTLDNVPLTIGNSTLTNFNNVSFINFATTATQLTVSNNGAGGPATFTGLTFAVTPTTGRYLSATDVDGAANGVLTLNFATPTPATPGSFVATAGGAVVNWPFAVPAKTWTGAVSTDWNNGSNWNPAVVPTATDTLVIPATVNQPRLAQNVLIKNLTVQPGAAIDLNGFQALLDGPAALPATPGFTGTGTIFATGATGTLQGNFGPTIPLVVQNPFTLAGRTITGPLTTGGGGTLTIAGQTLVATSLNIQNAGLVMGSAQDSVLVTGTSTFGGPANTALTAGTLVLGGDLTETGGFPAFDASGSHKTVLNGGALQSVTLNNGGFQALDLSAATGGVRIVSSAMLVKGTFTSTPSGAAPVIRSAGALLALRGGTQVTALTLDTTTVQLFLASGGPVQLDGLTFSNPQTFATAFEIIHPGETTPITLTNLAFTGTVPAEYLRANDSDGGPPNTLIIDLVNPTPATDGGRAIAVNGAVINWPASGSTITWTGTVSSDWFNGGNWSGGVVPAISDTAIILSGTPFTATLTNNTAVSAVTVVPTALLDLGAFVIVVNGTVDNGGLISSVTNGGVSLTGTGALLRGIFNTDVSVNGSYVMNGGLSAGNFSVANGDLDLGGRTLSVSTFSTLGTGVVRMTTPLDSLTVGTLAVFQGASTVGLLTDGVLSIGGDFLQDATNSTTSFSPSGKHKTVLTARGAASITFLSPGQGSGGSHFQVLDVSAATGGYTLGVNSIADSLISTSALVTLSGGGNSLTVRRAQVSGLTLDNVPFILDEQTSFAAENFSNVTFQGFGTTNTTMLTFSGLGGTSSARPTITTTNVNFQSLPIGANNFYVDVTSTNGGFVTFTMTGSNQSPQVGGNGPSLTKTGGGGVTVNWP